MNWSARRILTCTVACLFPFALASVGWTKPEQAWLEVHRANGSERCPGTDDLFRAIARLFPERDVVRATAAVGELALRARVNVHPTALGHEAVIRTTLPRQGERVIQDDDVQCGGLADALAVALVMQLEARAERNEQRAPWLKAVAPPNGPASEQAGETIVPPTLPSEAKPGPAPENQRGSAVAAPNQRDSAVAAPNQPEKPAQEAHGGSSQVRSPDPRSSRSRYVAAVHGAGAMGERALGHLAFGATVGASLFHDRGPGLFVEGIGLWSTPISAAGGTVRAGLWGLMAGPCQRLRTSRRTYGETCMVVGWGVERITPKGYREEYPSSRPWLVIGPSASLGARASDELAGFLRLGLLVHVLRGSLSIQSDSGAVQVVEPLVAGLMAELGVAYGGRVF